MGGVARSNCLTFITTDLMAIRGRAAWSEPVALRPECLWRRFQLVGNSSRNRVSRLSPMDDCTDNRRRDTELTSNVNLLEAKAAKPIGNLDSIRCHRDRGAGIR